MAELREGLFGSYYGSSYTSSKALTNVQMKLNARYIYTFLLSKGWTINAICGMLGNLQAESTLNPGRWQSDNVGDTSNGYGLVQWTPATNYLNWCEEQELSDPSEMDNNLNRIIYELNNGLQWITKDEYPLSFEEFTKSTESVEYLAVVFLKNYERAGVEVIETRQENASNWLTYLSGESVDPDPDTSDKKKNKKGFNFILFNKRRWNV